MKNKNIERILNNNHRLNLIYNRYNKVPTKSKNNVQNK